MNENIKAKVIVITGASSGFGEVTARHLSEMGATVVLGARRTERIESLAKALKAKGRQALAITTDVTDRNQVQKLVDAAVEAFGRIDINIKGVLYSIAAVLPYMQKQKAGRE